MSAIYIVNFSDPLKTGFAIQPNSEDGPGFARTNTDLYLHGSGSLDYGERINENFVHLLETFAGATPPTNPIEGQHWHKIQLYWREVNPSGSPVTAAWYRWNYTSSDWDVLSVTTSTAAPSSPVTGDYWFNINTDVLMRWEKIEDRPEAWIIREYTSNVATPTVSNRPPSQLKVWDDNAWVNASSEAIFATDADYPIISSTSFDIDASVAESAWESIGPTGSEATNIWTALDSVPTDVDWIEVKIVSNHVSLTDTVSASRTATLHSRKNGSSASASAMSQITYNTAYTNAAGHGTASSIGVIKLNVSSRKFDLYWSSDFNNATNFTIVLTGYGYNGA